MQVYTYFSVTGDFLPSELSALLAMQPERAWRAGEMRPDERTRYTESCWSSARVDADVEYIDRQLATLVSRFLPHIDTLVAFRASHNVEYTIEVVPTMSAAEGAPGLFFSKDVIAFCHAVGAQIDVDMYLLS